MKTHRGFGPIQDVHEQLEFGGFICDLHHIRLKTE